MMAEALGVASSITALINFAGTLIQYGLAVAEAPDEIRRLRASLVNLTSLLKVLKSYCHNASSDASWLQGIWGKSTVGASGVLAELEQTIEDLATKLNPSKNWKRSEAWQRMTWHFKKDFIDGKQADVMWYSSIIGLALTLKNGETFGEILRHIKEDRVPVNAQLMTLNNTLSSLELTQREELALALRSNETSSQISQRVKEYREFSDTQLTNVNNALSDIELKQRKELAFALENKETSNEILQQIQKNRDIENSQLTTLNNLLSNIEFKQRDILALALEDKERFKEVLNHIKKDREINNSQHKMLARGLSNIELTQKAENERRKRENDEIERAEIIDWLSPLSFLQKEKKLFAECFKETGDWLLQDQSFQFWAEQGHQWYLQCVGEPMVGKTVLSSILTHHLRSRTEVPALILCVYLDYKAATIQTSSNLMMSLLKQVYQLDELRPIPDELKRLYKRVKRLELVPTSYHDDIHEILMWELNHYNHFYLVVDGWDELDSEERKKFKKTLLELHPGKSSLLFMTRGTREETIKVGICDRCNKRDIFIYFHCHICNNGNYDLCLDCQRRGLRCEDASHKLSEPYGFRQIEVDIPDQDIQNYVRREIEAEMGDDNLILMDERLGGDQPDLTRFQRLCRRDSHLPDQVISTVVEKANGRFLFARLYLDLLRKALNLRELKRILASFPEDINDIYKESMHRIEKQDSKEDRYRAFRILGLITRARRPLTMGELQHALATMECGDDENLTEADIPEAVTDIDGIIEITSGLVIIEDNDNDHGKDVKLVHRSLGEYLECEESQLKWFPKVELEIARACLQYLSLVIPSEACDDGYWTIKNTDYPFLRYASQYWGDHVRIAYAITDPDAALQMKAMQFINNRRLNATIEAAWFTNLGGHDVWDVRMQVDRLHVCTWYGLSFAITALEPETSAVDVVEPKYSQTPLMYACRKGHTETVRQLLELGASLRKVSARGRTAMFEAILGQHDEVVELLTELVPPDLDINAVNPKQFRRTALMLAALLGYVGIVGRLLDYPGIEIDLQDVNGMTALYLAAKYDHVQIVELLLRFGARVDIGDYRVGRTALRVAAERDHEEIVRLLQKSGARIDLKDSSGGTAMLHAVRQGAEKALNEMIEAGGNLEEVNADGQSLLHSASEKNRSNITRTLIDKGLDPNIRDKSERTPLHIASQYGQATVLSLLLEKNADPTLRDRYGRTPKLVAWQYGHSEMVDLLESYEKSQLARQPEQLPDNTQLPIWSMARQGLEEVLDQAISRQQADVNITEPFSENTALHCAIDANRTGILPSLLQAGAIPINAPNRWKRTPLHLAALHGDLTAINLLISHGAYLDPRDRWDDEPLVLAQSNWHQDVMLELIVAGASIEKQEIDLEKLFFTAVEKGNVEAVHVLLSEGVDRSVQNSDGLRALQIAAAFGNEDMRQVLLRAPTVLFGAAGIDETGTGSEVAGSGKDSVERSVGAASFVPFRSRLEQP